MDEVREEPEVTSVAGLQRDALRFLRGFGLVAAGWTTLLAASAPTTERPSVLWVGVGVIWLWAVIATGVEARVRWWAGWLVAGVAAELLGPAAGTEGWSVAGGAPFVSIAAAALTGRRTPVAATVAILALGALARGFLSDIHTVGASVGTILVFVFGGLALLWLVRIVQRGEEERGALREAVTQAERERAVAVEREEAAARLHDSVLQSLAAITRAGSTHDARQLAADASTQLRVWLRGRGAEAETLRALLDTELRNLDDSRRVTISAAGDRPLDTNVALLVGATVEATRNALTHTTGPVRVYAETRDGTSTVWVADEGDGFDLDRLPEDRLGVRQSIVARLERAGGTAELRSGPSGSEWVLTLGG